MTVLDIDLDFFLDKIAHHKPFNLTRLDDKNYKPWTDDEVEHFLEKHCGLDKSEKIKGQLFTHHDEVFYYVRDEIIAGRIQAPLELVHVDAHSDLATGMDAAYIYIMDELLFKDKIADRYYPAADWEEKKLDAGNYLIYMIACRMISKLTFVKHQLTNEHYNDMFFKDFDQATSIFELKGYEDKYVQEVTSYAHNLWLSILKKREPKIVEPEVPFEEIFWTNYFEAKPFDMIFLTQSPSFTPKTSDTLIQIIQQYFV